MKRLERNDFLTMHEAGKVACRILQSLKKFIKPGISTKDIEVFFDNYLKGYPEMSAAFKGFSGYPASLCVSVNEEVIHGIPSFDKLIKDGDVVSVDLGIEYKTLFVDTAYTYLVGKTSPQAKKLVKITHEALHKGIARAIPGSKIGDVGSAIQEFIEKNGFSVVRKFVGHGIGKDLHLRPEVPNFGKKGEGEIIEEGTALAIEPMVCAGSYDVEIAKDGWTALTKDGSLAAHFEHTVAITKRGPWILTK
jgi:methionyl aminopeptidase